MFFRSFGFFLREGVRNIFTNGFMSLASFFMMVCCLILTGISFLFSENIKLALKDIEVKNSITIYLKPLSEEGLNEIRNKIIEIKNVDSCNLYPKDIAMKEYEGLLGEKVTCFFEGEGNPLPDSFKLSMSDLSKYDKTIEELKKIPQIDSISDRSEVAQKLTNLKRLIAIMGIWIISALSCVSLLIISNTIRITLHNRRFEISIMKSIGATNTFVRMPFIIEGIIIGVASAISSVLILNLIYGGIIKVITDIAPFKVIPFNKFTIEFLVFFTIIGILFGLLGGVISISRYLKKEGGEVAAW